jgi:hypothetical protein
VALFDQVLQALGQGVNDNDAQLVGTVFGDLLCLTLFNRARGMV